MRLGEFLVSKNLVSEADIEHALETQRQTRKFLGALAVEVGMLSRLENIRIIMAQRAGDKSYGEVAREKGLLTGEQVEQLVQLQHDTSLPLGKVLVAETSLRRFDLVMALKEYVETYKS